VLISPPIAAVTSMSARRVRLLSPRHGARLAADAEPRLLHRLEFGMCLANGPVRMKRINPVNAKKEVHGTTAA